MSRRPLVSIGLLILILAVGCSAPVPTTTGDGDPASPSVPVVDLAALARDGAGATAAFEQAVSEAETVAIAYPFEGVRPLQGWEARNQGDGFAVRDGVVLADAAGPDLRLVIRAGFDAAGIQRVLVNARVSAGSRGRLYWKTKAQPAWSAERSIQYWLHPGGEFRTYTIEVGEDEDWRGWITGLRLDPIDAAGRVEIDTVTFVAGLNRWRRDLLAARCAVPGASVELGLDRRRALALAPGEPLRLEPGRAAVEALGPGAGLRFALGLAATGEDGRPATPRAPYRFTVSDGRGETLFERVLDPGGSKGDRGWVEARVDPAAGADLASLTVAAEPLGGEQGRDVLALVANPLLQAARPPGAANVLVILVDALRADRLGCYGHPGGLTPHLDRLSRQSDHYRHAQSSSSWTAPAVASLFTGLHPYRHGVRYVDTLALGPEVLTVAERFLEAGWFTGAVSDNLLITPANGFDQGFRTFVSRPGAGERKAAELTDLALQWLDANGDRPFFLYLHYMDPHADYRPREPFHPGPPPRGEAIRPLVERGQAGGVVHRLQGDEGFRLTAAEHERLLALYEGEVAATDFELGRLLARLERDGLAGDTLVVFLADHGEEFMDHGTYTHASSLFDELVQVPLLVRLPGDGRIGRRVETVVRTADLGTALPGLAGVPGAGEAGAGALAGPLGAGGSAGGPGEAYFEINPYSRDPRAEGWIEATRGLRVGRHKLLYEVRTGRYRLYDLVADPGERRSVYAEGDPRSLELADRLRRYLEEADRAEAAGEGALLGDRQLQQLDALGYLDRTSHGPSTAGPYTQ